MSHYESPIRPPLVTGHKTYHDITVDIAYPIENKSGKLWWLAFSIALVTFLYGVGSIAYTIGTGIGVWGLDRKSTRLNSSHVAISYAVFCLKKNITVGKCAE